MVWALKLGPGLLLVLDMAVSRQARRLIAMWLYGRLPYNLWLQTMLNRAVDPTVIGRIISVLREHHIPKDPVLPPIDQFPYSGMADYNEWSLNHQWMKQSFNYLHRYCKVALSPDVTIADFIDMPVFIRTLYIPREDRTLSLCSSYFVSSHKYGIMFRIVDLAYRMTKTPQRCLPIPPAIEVGDESTALGVQPNKLLENSPLDH